ncbi:hypothetical protein Sulba_2490 [Sulfurospirillum barnesii SES-3]|uniref:Uncharacterized protein n=2 Tax=Sulfurospirillum barnesii TaxID=44674 RepID=I3Y0N3_SULBS|nr:hypothetical protein Sulba_2490 [Sulfurospirillum barnesii SES-3]
MSPLRSHLLSLVSHLNVVNGYNKFPIFDPVENVFTGEFVFIPFYAPNNNNPIFFYNLEFWLTGQGGLTGVSPPLFAIRYDDVYALCRHTPYTYGPLFPPSFSSVEDTSVYVNGEHHFDSSLDSAYSFLFDCVNPYTSGNVGHNGFNTFFTKTFYFDKYPNSTAIRWHYEMFDFFCFADGIECCYSDFSPIVKNLGATPSPVQLENLKQICYLLGVDTAENGLKECELMKEYLKRLNQILGGSPYVEPNDNLKSICNLLGVDSAENGLKECELSKDYVKRISKMLGAE